jgi:hypothetical protein
LSGWLRRLFGSDATPSVDAPSAPLSPAVVPAPVEKALFGVQLESIDQFADNVRDIEPGETVMICEMGEQVPEGLLVIRISGRRWIGTLPRSGPVWDAHYAGRTGLNSMQAVVAVVDRSIAPPRILLAVHIDKNFVPISADDVNPPPKSYAVGIVGESNYQPAIRSCRVGERVDIFHEVGNPCDEDALAVISSAGATIGYIGRDHWLQEVVHDEGKGVDATIMGIDGDPLGVVLDVVLTSGEVGTRAWST